MLTDKSTRAIVAAASTIGVGLGGFIDGIVFHQLLQFHNMLSARRPPTNLVNLEINMFWDRVFHLFCWLTCVGGLAMLWNAVKDRQRALSTSTFSGSLLLGWGLFNLVEGIINHHILHLHHVVETAGHLLFDLLFLGSGVLLVGIGWTLIQRDRHHGVEAARGNLLTESR